MFEAYAWPGNVRQLANVLRTAAVMADRAACITLHHLSDDFVEDAARGAAARAAALPPPPVQALSAPATQASQAAQGAQAAAPPPAAGGATLGAMEIDAIRRAVEAAGGNISEASKALGISRNTIYRKLHWRPPGGP